MGCELHSVSQPYLTYFQASASLATVLELQDDPQGALDVLERASHEQRRTGIFGRVSWMLIQLRLAAIYRELGREAEAMQLEDEVRALLAYADPDFWLVQRLPADAELRSGSKEPTYPILRSLLELS